MTYTPIFKFAIREDLQDCTSLFMPKRATLCATGWDVRAAFPDRAPVTIEAGQTIKIPLGFRTFCPEGWWFELKPRSSTFAKKNLHCLYGTIDQDYQGELILAAQYIPNVPFSDYESVNLGLISIPKDKHTITIEWSEALGQIIPIKRQEMIVEEISNSKFDSLCQLRGAERGAGGFGSTSGK